MDGVTGIFDEILEADWDEPRKQRHTAQNIFDRLRDEHGFIGGYAIVKDNVRARRQSTREALAARNHPPGHAWVDFGEVGYLPDQKGGANLFFQFVNAP